MDGHVDLPCVGMSDHPPAHRPSKPNSFRNAFSRLAAGHLFDAVILEWRVQMIRRPSQSAIARVAWGAATFRAEL